MGGLKNHRLGAENVERAVVMLLDLPSLERGHKKGQVFKRCCLLAVM